MCRLDTETWLICGHTTTSDEACFKATMLRRKCAPYKQKPESTLANDICPACSTFWDYHAVPSYDARAKYRAFRKKHKYQGPLGPVQHRNSHPPVLQRERFSTEDLRIEQELNSIDKDLEAFDKRRESADSDNTMWPTFVPQELTEVPIAMGEPSSRKGMGHFDRTWDHVKKMPAGKSFQKTPTRDAYISCAPSIYKTPNVPPVPAHIRNQRPNLGKPLPRLPNDEEIDRPLQARAGNPRPPPRLRDRPALEGGIRHSLPSPRYVWSSKVMDAGRPSSASGWL
jgi:hypothetical protein